MTNYWGTPVRPSVRTETKDNKTKMGLEEGCQAERKQHDRTESVPGQNRHGSHRGDRAHTRARRWTFHVVSRASDDPNAEVRDQFDQTPGTITFKTVTKETLKSTSVQRRNRAQGTDKFSARAHETDCTNTLNPRTTKWSRQLLHERVDVRTTPRQRWTVTTDDRSPWRYTSHTRPWRGDRQSWRQISMSNVGGKSSSLFPMTDDVERCQQVHGRLRQDDQIVSVQLVAEAEVWTRAQSDIRLNATYGRWMQFHQLIDKGERVVRT